jgi:RHS repeat-associated protein
VQKITSSGTTNYIYDAMGHLAAEYGGSSTSAGRVYLSVDALGSTRLVTDASGNPTEQYDYAPFGEELTQGIDGRVALYSTNQYPTTPDAVTEKFTSKERDAESGLDYFGARYFSGAQGRFTSPDPLPWIHWQHGNRDDQQDSQHTLQIRKTSTCMRT